MAKLDLSVAVGDYDRTRPLIDGSVAIDGVRPIFMTLSPEEIFFRAFRAAEFDVCELSLSSYTLKTAQGDSPYVAVPAFVSRAFRHTAIYVRTDRVKKPADSERPQSRRARISAHCERVGARVAGRRFWRQARGHSLDPRRHRGGRPAGEADDQAAARRSPRQRAGRRNDFGAAGRARSTASSRRGRPLWSKKGHPNIGWLFSDPVAAAKDYFKRTGYFPIMHVVGVRRTLAERHPWLPGAVYKAFEQAKVLVRQETLRHFGDEGYAAVR